jgi:hypothetical protein
MATSISHVAPPTETFTPSTLYVGNPEVCERLAAKAAEVGLSRLKINLDPHVEDARTLIFGRDWRVTLLDGSHLIPFATDDPVLSMMMKAILPFPSSHFVRSIYQSCGEGLTTDHQAKAIAACERLGIPHKIGKTAIEGGNCKLFLGRDGKPRAIVGINSLMLSYLALEKQGYFATHGEEIGKLAESIETPFESSLLAVRNRELSRARIEVHAKISDVQNKQRNPSLTLEERKGLNEQFARLHEELRALGTTLAYQDALQAPLSEEDRLRYKDQAIHFQACLECTKQVIAEELKVPLEQTAFVHQYSFHIDLDLLVTPEGDVLFHDERPMSAHLEEELTRARGRSVESFHKYLAGSLARRDSIRTINDHNTPILASIGCKAIPIGGLCQGEGEMTANFMNGVYIVEPSSKAYFFTNGAESKHAGAMALFKETMERASPSTQVVFLAEGERLFSEILTSNKGGLHCLTWTS